MIRETVSLCLAVLAVSSAAYQPPKYECVKNAYPPKDSPAIPWFNIDLDLQAKERWKEVTTHYQKRIATLLTTFKNFIYDIGSSFADDVMFYIDTYMAGGVATLPYPFADEIGGVSFYSGLNLGEVMLYNVLYEVFSVCTSIVAEDPNGYLVHGRNLDFGFLMGWDVQNKTWAMTEALRPLAVNINFQRQGNTVFQAAGFAGYVGVLTGLKKKLFSLTVNERFDLTSSSSGLWRWLKAVGSLGGGEKTATTAMYTGFVARSVMENASSYGQALTTLTSAPLMAPTYFILAAAHSTRAVVITRSPEGPADVWAMSSQTDHPWFLVQTNYDHWTQPFYLDDRRSPAIRCMLNATREAVGVAGLYNVLSTQPVLNKLTTYTALMQVSSGSLESYSRYCKDPCFPW